MALMQIRLIQGTGERLESTWEGICPCCGQLSNFHSDYFEADVLNAVTRGIGEAFFSGGQSFFNLVTADTAIDVIGCENCGHAMAICPNCQVAYSTDKNATLYFCPSCKTNYS